MDNAIKKLNKIFIESEHLYNSLNVNPTRKCKISFHNTLEYIFKYSQKGTTKRDIMSQLKVYAHRSSYDRKLKNISTDFFKELFLKVQELYTNEINLNGELKNIVKLMNNNFNELNINDKSNVLPKELSNELPNELPKELSNVPSNKMSNDINKKYKIVAYDGTVNSRIQNGLLNTDQNLFGYDVNFNIPLTLNNNDILTYNNKNNNSNKNSEITMFINYIKNNPKDCENVIFIGDRLYSVYDVFDYITKNKGKYIFRLKSTLHILDDNKTLNKKDKNYKIKCAIRDDPNIKIIEYTETTIKKIASKTNEIKTYKVQSTFHLITNLGGHKDYNDKLIKDIYNSRWNIEVFNKYIKNNFKFEQFYLKNNDEIEKIKYIDLIITTIIKLLSILCIYEKRDKLNLNDVIKKKFKKSIASLDKRTKLYRDYSKNFKKTKKVSIRVNLTLFTSKFYDTIVKELVYGELTLNTMNDIKDKDIDIYKNELDRVFKRQSIVPFTKWYVKMYHKKYEYEKIIKAITENTVDKLNKNLKCKANGLIISLFEND